MSKPEYEVIKQVTKKRKPFRSEEAYKIGMILGILFLFVKVAIQEFPVVEGLGFIVTMSGFWFAKRAVYHNKNFNAEVEG